MKSIRDSIYISNLSWCLIQSFILIIGCILVFHVGILLANLTGFIDIAFLSVIVWVIVFMLLKYTIENKFDDCIEV